MGSGSGRSFRWVRSVRAFPNVCALYSYSDSAFFFATFLWRLTLALELSHRAGSGAIYEGRPLPTWRGVDHLHLDSPSILYTSSLNSSRSIT